MSNASKILMGSGASAPAYEIEQSLNFNWGDDSVMKRTPSTTGNRKTWTVSMWLKRHADSVSGGTNHTYGVFWGTDDGGGTHYTQLTFYHPNSQIDFTSYHYSSGATFRLRTNRIFRDTSAWFHLVFVLDTTQSTTANRMKMYINGIEETSFSDRSDPAQNRDGWVNYANNYDMLLGNGYIGNAGNVNYQTSFGVAELNFIDGTALTPSSFAETNSATGQWVPKEYSGSYGTNGYYLKFVSGAIGTDSSGEGNNFSLTTVVNSDVVKDSPTNNFCTMNPLSNAAYVAGVTPGGHTLKEGNLRVDGQGDNNGIAATTQIPSSGKWYWEFTFNASANNQRAMMFGIYAPEVANLAGGGAGGTGLYGLGSHNGYLYAASGGPNFSGTFGTSDILQVAVDMDNGALYFGKNNTWANSGDPTSGSSKTGAAGTDLISSGYNWVPHVKLHWRDLAGTFFSNFGQSSAFGGTYNSLTPQGNPDGNGYGDFYYTPPSDYLALSTANFPNPAITPSENFNAVLYTGNDTDGRTISGVGFQPDFVWHKARNVANSNWLFDSVRGTTKFLSSNETVGEYTQADSLSAFTSDGFTVSDNTAGADMNSSAHTYVAWNWKAGGAEPAITYAVTVVSDSGNKYRFDGFGTSAVTLDLQEGGTYTFDQSHSSNSGHPFVFGTSANATDYTTGVTTSGTPGSSGAYTRITVAASAPTIYYACSAHSGMGGQVNTNSAFGSTNTKGSMNSVVSANQAAGFSIATWTGNGAAQSIGHGLSKDLEFLIVKNRENNASWVTQGFGPNVNDYVYLNNYDPVQQTTAFQLDITRSNDGTFHYGGSSIGQNGIDYLAYCFHSIENFSRIGKYVGNASINGPFTQLGFRPAYIMVRRSDVGSNWYVFDNRRDPNNDLIDIVMKINLNSAESPYGDPGQLDFLSNGFKIRRTTVDINANGGTYYYVAFAESPFKYANAR
jgi:hypothetical protein